MRASLGLLFIGGLYACTAVGPGEDSPGPESATTTTDGNGPSDDGEPGDTGETGAPKTLAKNLAITNVSVFQGVEVDVVKSGALVAKSKRNAPLVAKRAGMMRIFVKPGDDWEAASVTAEVRLVSGTKQFPVLRDTKTIKAASTDASLTSTFNVDLPTDDLPAGVTFQVALTMKEGGEEVSAGTESSARFPTDGTFEELGVQNSGTLKVVVVPITYEADGTGRAPDVGQKQLKIYEDTLLKLYPTAEVELSTHDPVSWTTTISRNGSGFSNVLNAMYQLRQKDRADDDVYYYGVFNPASSIQSFCSQGCVAGLSTVADEDAPMMRASVGLGFNGQQAADTMAHELGHAHGREHAPCGGADGVDPNFPYKNGSIGVYAYDATAKSLISPTVGTDMMGYCDNVWMSDYTYRHIFDRIVSVNTAQNLQAAGKGTTSSATSEATEWQMATVGADGALSWDATASTMTAPLRGGSLVRTRFLAQSGVEVGSRDAHFFRYDHVPGGVLFVPRERALDYKAIKVDGFRQTLAR